MITTLSSLFYVYSSYSSHHSGLVNVSTGHFGSIFIGLVQPQIKLPAVNMVDRISLSLWCCLELFGANLQRQVVWMSVTLEAPHPEGGRMVLVDLLVLVQ